MAHASEAVSESPFLAGPTSLTFSSNGYTYRIERRGDQSIYSVTDSKQTFEIPIGWVIGAGRIGQTFVFQRDGTFYEGRVSYYSDIHALDTTIGDSNPHPHDLIDADGRRMQSAETTRCFGCHMTDVVENGKLTLEKIQQGVQCIRCHTAAAKHLSGLAEGDLDLDEMTKLKTMSTDEISNFCGQRHRTLEDVLARKQPKLRQFAFSPTDCRSASVMTSPPLVLVASPATIPMRNS